MLYRVLLGALFKNPVQGKILLWYPVPCHTNMAHRGCSTLSELYISPKRPNQREAISHRWTKSNILVFESSSNSGHPKTLTLKISTVSRHVDSRDDVNMSDDDLGCAFVDLSPIWKQTSQTTTESSFSSSARIFLFDETEELFDQHGVAERHTDEREVRNCCII